jgi:hypothetical protein
MINKDQTLLEEIYNQIHNKQRGSSEPINESEASKEATDCHDIIKKLVQGKFRNETEEVIERIKKCKSIFSVTQDSAGNYDVIIKDSALSIIEDLYPNLIGKFKSAADCKKDIAKCRKDKL